MDFGDWPGWIALASAIISPVITVWLNNRHQRKMEEFRITSEIERAKGILLSELQSIGASKIEDYSGFSPNAMMALLFVDESVILAMEELNHALLNAKTSDEDKEHIVSDIPVFGEDANGRPYTYFKFCKMIAIKIANSKSVVKPKSSLRWKKQKQ